MKIVQAAEITSAIREMCYEANHSLTKDMEGALYRAEASEESPLGKQILKQLQSLLKPQNEMVSTERG